MFRKRFSQKAVLLFIIGIQFSSCGGQSYRELAPTPATTPEGSTGGGGGTGIPGTGGIEPPETDTGQFPAITQSFSVTGSGGTLPSFSTNVSTDNILKVQVEAAAGDRISLPGQYSNFEANYGCVTYTVTALGQSKTTKVLAVPAGTTGPASSYLCSGAPSKEVLDFSGRLGPGHNSVTIQVVAAGYDFYCKHCYESYQLPYYMNPYFPNGCASYCPVKSVFKNHTVNGNLSIQVNGTGL